MARQPLHRGRDAAAARVAHQRRQAGRAGEADPHRRVEAEVAQPADPADDRIGVEAELRDDVQPQPGRLRGRDLVRERAVELDVPGCADGLRDSRRCRPRGCRGAAAARCRSRRARCAASLRADRDRPRSPAPAAPPPPQPSRARKRSISPALANARTARCGTGSKPRLPQPRRMLDRFVGALRRHRADIDAGPGRHDAAERRDVVGLRARRLDRIAAHEGADGSDRVGALVPVCHRQRHGFHVVARSSRSVAPPRDHEGFVVEPEPAALLQHLAGGVEIAPVRHHVGRAGRPRPAPRRSRRSRPRTASRCRSTRRFPTAACACRSGTASGYRHRR